MENIELKFKSAKEMVDWLMDNEGREIFDMYGRKWLYNKYTFFFKNIGESDEYEPHKLNCLHLFGTTLKTNCPF